MPLQATSGAASYDAFGGGVAAVPNYIEDVFSTYLYTGNASTQVITNGIDLSTKGGLVWTKSRSLADAAFIYDTARGINKFLIPSSTQSSVSTSRALTSFNVNGFTLGDNDFSNDNAGELSVSWTFRKQPKFFDVVTYTGTGSNTTIQHNLGSVPGCIIVKRTDSGANWWVYHISLGNTKYIVLNENGGDAITSSTAWNNTSPTSTTFSIGTNAVINTNGGTYVAYIYAHDSGGFGLTGTDNVISCGSYTGNGSADGPTINLGYEPQYLIIKNSNSGVGNWQVIDNMRGMPVGTDDATLQINASNSESAAEYVSPTATGFKVTTSSDQVNTNGGTCIYIAIRRGPMKVPTDGTKVFEPFVNGATTTPGYVTSFPPDLCIAGEKSGTDKSYVVDRLRGAVRLNTTSTAAEAAQGSVAFYQNGAFNQDWQYGYNSWVFRRAPSFFDEVCYTGDGTASRNITHNLATTPQLIFAKSRSNVANWVAYNSFGNGLILNSAAAANSGFNFITSASATTFTPADPASFGGSPNQSGQTYVAYLFATCPAVSKVGSYTGTGTTKQIDCGFTGGARFVLIKKTSGTGSWYVWDSARGIVSGNDPYLLLNSTAAEVTSTDYIDTYSAGFEISSTAPSEINESGGSFIFLAIA